MNPIVSFDPDRPLAVYKYPLSMNDRYTVSMPAGAMVLHFGMQGQVPTLWALVDPKMKLMQERHFRIAGTGHPLAETGRMRYVGTTHDGPFVWHCFEVI